MKILLALLTLFASLAHARSGPQFLSLSAGFEKFAAESAHMDLEAQIKSWQANVESQIPDVYLHIIADDDASQMDAKRREQAAKYFPFLLEHIQDIRAQFKIYEGDGKAIIGALVAAYPEADMSQVTVIGMPSLDHFNGQVEIVKGKVYVLFGMDMIAKILLNPGFINGAYLLNDTKVLMAHEFTHALNFRLSDLGNDDNTSAAFWNPIWTEGLAQVNSQMLNPGTILEYVFMERNLQEACTPQNVAKWASEYLQDSQGDMAALYRAYVKWFNMQPTGLQVNGVYRAGYCLGYNVILKTLRQYSMTQILALPRSAAYVLVQEALKDFAATPLVPIQMFQIPVSMQ